MHGTNIKWPWEYFVTAYDKTKETTLDLVEIAYHIHDDHIMIFDQNEVTAL
jgi:hypothetical protein